jgi:hypothetical protein
MKSFAILLTLFASIALAGPMPKEDNKADVDAVSYPSSIYFSPEEIFTHHL